jgi:hypothetical protein
VGRARTWAPDGLLDSYHTERSGVALEVTDDSLAQCVLLANPSREGMALRDRFNALPGTHPPLAAWLGGPLDSPVTGDPRLRS